MFTLRSLWFVMQQQQVMLAHYPVKPFGIHRWLSLCATLLAQDAPHASITITRHIADNVEDSRQYFCVCFFITPVTAPVLPVAERLIRSDSCARDTPMVRLTMAIPRPLATRARALSIFATDRTPRLLSGSQLPSSSCPEGAEAPGPASEQQ